MGFCVVQEWLYPLSWKKQTVALECLRAPDTACPPMIRQMFRWMRGAVLHNADPTTRFMAEQKLPEFDDVERDFERLPLHCAHHVLMTLQIIAYEHPERWVKGAAYRFYLAAVTAQHLAIETKATYEQRYLDKRASSVGGSG